MKNHVYKIKKNFLKNPEKFGFFVGADEEGKEKIYAKKICLDKDTPIMKRVVSMLEAFYASASDDERKTDFSEFKFNKNGKIKYETKLGECQVCFSTKEKPRNVLFINAPDGKQYYNVETLNKHLGNLIIDLLKANYIEFKNL